MREDPRAGRRTDLIKPRGLEQELPRGRRLTLPRAGRSVVRAQVPPEPSRKNNRGGAAHAPRTERAISAALFKPDDPAGGLKNPPPSPRVASRTLLLRHPETG